MKRILYDTGWWTVARRPAVQESLEAWGGQLWWNYYPWPPKKLKKKFVLKCILGHVQCFETMFFLVENRPIRPPPS